MKTIYKKGQIVAWLGINPCIGKIIGKCSTFDNCYKINNNTHNSLHIRNLRPATKEEKKLLGKKVIHLL